MLEVIRFGDPLWKVPLPKKGVWWVVEWPVIVQQSLWMNHDQSIIKIIQRSNSINFRGERAVFTHSKNVHTQSGTAKWYTVRVWPPKFGSFDYCDRPEHGSVGLVRGTHVVWVLTAPEQLLHFCAQLSSLQQQTYNSRAWYKTTVPSASTSSNTGDEGYLNIEDNLTSGQPARGSVN